MKITSTQVKKLLEKNTTDTNSVMNGMNEAINSANISCQKLHLAFFKNNINKNKLK